MRRRSGFGWVELIAGILLILFGIYTVIRPGSALTKVMIFYGILAVITGIADIILYVRIERFTGFGPTVSLISGILSVMAGVMLLVYPGAGKWVLSLLFPIWFIAHCISRLSHLNVVRAVAGNLYYTISLVISIMGIVLGCIMIFRPVVSFLSAGITIGSYLILLGTESIITAFNKQGKGW